MQNEEYMLNDLAWERLFRHRCCPPDRVLFAGENEMLRAHLQHCPWCRAELEAAIILPSAQAAAQEGSASAPPEPGEIRAVDLNYAGWGKKGRYYNPPLVLVLAAYPDKRVEVMQLYDDFSMAGPDDFMLGPAFQLFAETWNRYTLEPDMLGWCYGTIAPGVLERCRAYSAAPEVEQGSLIWFFRQLEVECGYHFFKRSLLQRQKNSLRELSPELLADQLRGLGLDCVPGGSALETLAAARIPDERLPRAAHAGRLHRHGMSVYLRGGEVAEYRTHPIQLSLLEFVKGRLLVSGLFEEDPPESDEYQFWCRSGDRLVLMDPAASGCSKGTLWAAFDCERLPLDEDLDRLELVFRFFHYLSD
jgi:hypothetical protein